MIFALIGCAIIPMDESVFAIIHLSLDVSVTFYLMTKYVVHHLCILKLIEFKFSFLCFSAQDMFQKMHCTDLDICVNGGIVYMVCCFGQILCTTDIYFFHTNAMVGILVSVIFCLQKLLLVTTMVTRWMTSIAIKMEEPQCLHLWSDVSFLVPLLIRGKSV